MMIEDLKEVQQLISDAEGILLPETKEQVFAKRELQEAEYHLDNAVRALELLQQKNSVLRFD